MDRCFHCHEPVPHGTDCSIERDGARFAFCCPGCRAVAELIHATGLERFYDFRTAPAPKAPEHAAADHEWAVCDRPEVERQLVRPGSDGLSQFRFRVDGVNCAACAWLIDRGLSNLAGVSEVSVNPVSREALVRFDAAELKPSAILDAVERYGFAPRLGAFGSGEAATSVTRDELKRLAVAGLGFAQVMMLSAALYLGAFKAMNASFTNFFVLASMLVATPVVLYAGAPLFRSALTDLAHRRMGMDVPVSLAIAIALAASLVNAFRGAGEVYFDSATMFVFFLTLGRFLEARARHKAGGLVAALAELKPLGAWRKHGDRLERVGTIELEPGDLVVVEPGEALPADGELRSVTGLLDESLLSGESRARRRSRGEVLLGGSLNIGGAPLEIEVTQAGNDGYIDRVGSLLHRAMADRPEFLRLADRWAGVFVATVLVVTALTGGIWLWLAPERALGVVLAMLVVTCPCALSLAAPTAFAVALGRLARLGLLCRSARVLERLGQVGVWLFDKTGTLTEGRIGIVRVEPLRDLAAEDCLAIAAALEAGIEHPIARALAQAADVAPAADVEYVAGFGVVGTSAGRRWRLGSARHVGSSSDADGAQCIYLADDAGAVARIVLADRVRPKAREALASLSAFGTVALVSGDATEIVGRTAQGLGIDEFWAMQSPADKLEQLRRRQAKGEVVAAVGDGINDAPWLAQADVSVAMLSGSRLAQASADIVFTGEDLRRLARLPELAGRTRSIVRQNLLWAVLYNLGALPLAATGILEPWMAALGMSLSSVVVVANALRLNRLLAERPQTAIDAGPAPDASVPAGSAP
jgi:Cu2+-exporting ATPase